MSNSTFGGNGEPELIDLVCEDEGGPSSGDSSSKGLEAFLTNIHSRSQKGADNNSPMETVSGGREEDPQKSPQSHCSDPVATADTERQLEQGPSLLGPARKLQFNRGPQRPLTQEPRKRKKGPLNHVCYFCQRKLSVPSLLERHLVTHTKEKPFPCTLCGKEFAQKVHLNLHLRFHRKEKRFTCNFCGKGFVEKGALDRHIRYHVKEKAFKCNLCGKDFVQKGDLDRHIRGHLKEKWFKCPHPDCTSSFVSGSELKVHSRVHSGEKPFPCPYPNCGKHFTTKQGRDDHHRTHTGEKPFVCGCGKKFAKSSNLRRHRKKCDEGNRVTKKRKVEEHLAL